MPQIHDGSDSGAGKDGEVTAILMAVMAPTSELVSMLMHMMTMRVMVRDVTGDCGGGAGDSPERLDPNLIVVVVGWCRDCLDPGDRCL